MSVMWIEEIVNYTPITDSDFKYEDLYQCSSICETNNGNVLLYLEQILNDVLFVEPLGVEEFKWC